MTYDAPYRTSADLLGELRKEFRGRWTGQLVFGAGSVAALVLLIAGSSVKALASFGSVAAIVADVRKLGHSEFLVFPFLWALGGLFIWLLVNVTRALRRQRVRFYQHGLELVARNGDVKRCRFEQIDRAELMDDRDTGGSGDIVGLKVFLISGETWIVAAWFDVAELQARLTSAIRAARS
jgi:hypothetical protein